MALTATTLTNAIGTTDTLIVVGSVSGFSAPVFQQGAIPGSGGVGPYNVVQVDQEWMRVDGVNSTALQVQVSRGLYGSAVVAHAAGAPAIVGLPSDFLGLQLLTQTRTSNPILQAFGPELQIAQNLAGSADALTGAAGVFVVKTAGVDAITIPTPTLAQEGNLVYVYSDTTNAHTITAATTCIAAGQALKTTITFPAFAGAFVGLRAQNLKWVIVANGGVAAAGSCTLS